MIYCCSKSPGSYSGSQRNPSAETRKVIDELGIAYSPMSPESSQFQPRRTQSQSSINSQTRSGSKFENRQRSLHFFPTESFHVLNEVVLDRGPSAYMSQLELFVNSNHLTTIQADGVVLSTPTGSTAYSLSAGGSLVHPDVPSILLSPICPHSLSFRPMLLPDSSEIKLQVPLDSRYSVWASFDGKHRIELTRGDYVIVTRSRYPMMTITSSGLGRSWFQSISRCLHWVRFRKRI